MVEAPPDPRRYAARTKSPRVLPCRLVAALGFERSGCGRSRLFRVVLLADRARASLRSALPGIGFGVGHFRAGASNPDATPSPNQAAMPVWTAGGRGVVAALSFWRLSERMAAGLRGLGRLRPLRLTLHHPARRLWSLRMVAGVRCSPAYDVEPIGRVSLLPTPRLESPPGIFGPLTALRVCVLFGGHCSCCSPQ
jgi:hypothetical protein